METLRAVRGAAVDTRIELEVAPTATLQSLIDVVTALRQAGLNDIVLDSSAPVLLPR